MVGPASAELYSSLLAKSDRTLASGKTKTMEHDDDDDDDDEDDEDDDVPEHDLKIMLFSAYRF